MTNPDTTVTFRYRHVLPWIGITAVSGALSLWVAIDPRWGAVWDEAHAHSLKQCFLLAIPSWIIRPIFLVAGAALIASAAWTAVAVRTRAPIVTITRDWIEARTTIGRHRRLAWSEITDAVAFKAQIVLRTGKAGTAAQARLGLQYNDSSVTWEWLMFNVLGPGIWSHDAVIIDVNMIDAAPGAIKTLIALHKPGLVIRPVRWM